MKNTIKTIEDLSLNAWPSHQIQLYDGWLLRFSYFYTHRTNCIEQIGSSSIPLQDKLDYCEEIYEKWGTPAIYKITPLISSAFDQKLTERGYHTAHVTEVMTMDLNGMSIPLVLFPWLCPLLSLQNGWRLYSP